MEDSGIDLRTWLVVLGVMVAFFGLPGAVLESDRRKRLAAKAREISTRTRSRA